MSRYLFALGQFVARRRWWMLVVWVVLLIGAITFAASTGGKTNDNFTVPGTLSIRGEATGADSVSGKARCLVSIQDRPEPVARWLAISTTLYLKLFGWLIWLFDQSSNVPLRALRIEPVHDVEHSATPRDLEHIVAASRNAGNFRVSCPRCSTASWTSLPAPPNTP